MFASGDDVVFLGEPKILAKIQQAILSKSSRDHLGHTLTGQIVKSAQITELREIEFCSKWFFWTNEGLMATRDYKKTLCTKMHYSK